MNYIIFDLELNSKMFKSHHPNEIIEIGAVKLSSNLETLGTFQSFVKPKMFKRLSPIVRRKTNITQELINNAESFKEVLDKFKLWIDQDYILCSWGHDDIHHFKSNCEFNRRSSKWLKRNFDIQNHVSKLYELPAGHRFSLKNALIALDIPVEEDLHRADVDAKYTAEVFKKVFETIK